MRHEGPLPQDMQTRKAARVTVTRLFDLVYVFNTRDYSCSVLERGLALLLTLFRLWLLARLTPSPHGTSMAFSVSRPDAGSRASGWVKSRVRATVRSLDLLS